MLALLSLLQPYSVDNRIQVCRFRRTRQLKGFPDYNNRIYFLEVDDSRGRGHYPHHAIYEELIGKSILKNMEKYA